MSAVAEPSRSNVTWTEISEIVLRDLLITDYCSLIDRLRPLRSHLLLRAQGLLVALKRFGIFLLPIIDSGFEEIRRGRAAVRGDGLVVGRDGFVDALQALQGRATLDP